MKRYIPAVAALALLVAGAGYALFREPPPSPAPSVGSLLVLSGK